MFILTSARSFQWPFILKHYKTLAEESYMLAGLFVSVVNLVDLLSEAMFECEQCWSSPQTASSILPHKPANPWRPNSHVQDYPWSPGIPHGVQLHTSNPQRSTQPHRQVPPTPTRRRQFAFTIRSVPFWSKLRPQIINASSVKSFKTYLDAHWQSLFPEVPI